MKEVETILRDFESGRLNGRQLVAVLSALVASSGAARAKPESTFEAAEKLRAENIDQISKENESTFLILMD